MLSWGVSEPERASELQPAGPAFSQHGDAMNIQQPSIFNQYRQIKSEITHLGWAWHWGRERWKEGAERQPGRDAECTLRWPPRGLERARE